MLPLVFPNRQLPTQMTRMYMHLSVVQLNHKGVAMKKLAESMGTRISSYALVMKSTCVHCVVNQNSSFKCDYLDFRTVFKTVKLLLIG